MCDRRKARNAFTAKRSAVPRTGIEFFEFGDGFIDHIARAIGGSFQGGIVHQQRDTIAG